MMVLTKKTPSATHKTPFGYVFGTVSHEWYFAKMDAEAEFWYNMIPDVKFLGFSITGWLKSIVKSIYQKAYDRNYQKAYDSGAQQGDKVYNDMTSALSDLKNRLESNIQDAYNKAVDRVNQLKKDVDNAVSRVQDLSKTVSGIDSKAKELESKIKSFASELDKHFKMLQDLDRRVKELEKKSGVGVFKLW